MNTIKKTYEKMQEVRGLIVNARGLGSTLILNKAKSDLKACIKLVGIIIRANVLDRTEAKKLVSTLSHLVYTLKVNEDHIKNHRGETCTILIRKVA